MQTQEQAKLPTDKNDRRRGRPAGKNRIPLSLAERRSRNAQYERERRNETAEAMAQLAEAACCDPRISHPELLATVINRLQSAQNQKPLTSIEDLKRINKKLESQITELQSRLENNSESQVNIPNIDSDGSTTPKSKPNSENSQSQRPFKYRKTEKENTVHDRKKKKKKKDKLVHSSLTSIRHSESSSGSQDSTWPYHQLKKTAPSQEGPISNVPLFSNSVSSLQRAESTLNSQIRSEKELYKERSYQSEGCSTPAMKQDYIKLQYRIPGNVQTKLEQSVPDLPKMGYMDPFTEREKCILESLGCSDYINFDEHHDGNQTCITWPPDYDGYSNWI